MRRITKEFISIQEILNGSNSIHNYYFEISKYIFNFIMINILKILYHTNHLTYQFAKL